ncbi:hypothetical protein [Micromonospora sp. NPDC047730]|uniref:hypothetical protein n=1 Tax=Micromonospora sp. NPDC047730 TaxID=3364253 RepID=UPI00371889C1
MHITSRDLTNLIEDVSRGKLTPAEGHRGSSWAYREVIDLANSVLTGAPIGAVVIDYERRHLIDGRERLMTLAAMFLPADERPAMPVDGSAPHLVVRGLAEGDGFEVLMVREEDREPADLPLSCLLRTRRFLAWERAVDGAHPEQATGIKRRGGRLAQRLHTAKVAVIELDAEVSPDRVARLVNRHRIG